MRKNPTPKQEKTREKQAKTTNLLSLWIYP